MAGSSGSECRPQHQPGPSRRRTSSARPPLDLGQFGQDQPRATDAYDERRAKYGDGRQAGQPEQQRDGNCQHLTNPFETTGQAANQPDCSLLARMFPICSVLSNDLRVAMARPNHELVLDFSVRDR
jgi:hypothetical protein